MKRLAALCVLLIAVVLPAYLVPGRSATGGELQVALFDVDASPAIGSPLAYDPTAAVESPLHCRGIVLLGAGKPIVLCAVDWLGIGNESNIYFRETFAKALETTRDRVAVHVLHQHDAPRSDLSAERLLIQSGVSQPPYDATLTRRVAREAAQAAARAIKQATVVTHMGLGEAAIEKVASNRRILGPDGKVRAVRFTSCKDPAIRAEPAGTIDPSLKMISLWNNDRCIVALTFYATHPQSYYRTGKANPDFPGIARAMRDEATGVVHVHFNGAGGNVGAGKWNDGSPKNRPILAGRVAAGMEAAWKKTERSPLAAEQVDWKTTAVALPVGAHLKRQQLEQTLTDPKASDNAKITAAKQLVWLNRCENGDRIDIACLKLGKARILFMPGELFVEYQLAAQQMRRDCFVAMAAYGEYGPCYIGTKIAYSEGGYETSPRVSYVAPEVEDVLMSAMRKLLTDRGGSEPKKATR